MDDLQQLLNNIWTELTQSCTTKNHPYRTPVVGTINGQYSCELRTVVLREVNRLAHTLTFFTDLRSGKVKDMSLNPTLSWLFYDPTTQVQIRASGDSLLIKDSKILQNYWDRLPENNRKEYASSQAPGSSIENNFTSNLLSNKESFKNFGVVVSEINKVDWLKLNPFQHQRALFEKEEGKWNKTQIVP
ncbi:pyridoxamine 5'-phosphate oxidase family protein [Flammeovirgaceae bacterium SG7u.111]|nr:pyridoxamine 5'-phosphate oxidase family protein [Flammeovirgaceae bacterium SG7u.132]WPO35653.1 pyridoxamine 5'-phosphate oxidase family protein [Flammeovirgaceae bacterium SG7u.111]